MTDKPEPTFELFDTRKSGCLWFEKEIKWFYNIKNVETFKTTVKSIYKTTYKTVDWKPVKQISTSHWYGESIKTEKEPITQETVVIRGVWCNITPEMMKFANELKPFVRHFDKNKQYLVSTNISGQYKDLSNLKEGHSIIVRPYLLIEEVLVVEWKLVVDS